MADFSKDTGPRRAGAQTLAMDAPSLTALCAAAVHDPIELKQLLDVTRSGEVRDVDWEVEVS